MDSLKDSKICVPYYDKFIIFFYPYYDKFIFTQIFLLQSFDELISINIKSIQLKKNESMKITSNLYLC